MSRIAPVEPEGRRLHASADPAGAPATPAIAPVEPEGRRLHELRVQAQELAEEVPLAVSEVRQWSFCPRVLWHRRVMPHRVAETPKMALGREAQSVLEGLEKRRTGRRYGLAGAVRRFEVRVASAQLGVRGTCDAVLEVPCAGGAGEAAGGGDPVVKLLGEAGVPCVGDAGEAAGEGRGAGEGAGVGGVGRGARRLFPVEVKRTEGGVGAHHVAQLAGYAMLLEEQEGLAEGAVGRGFVVLLPAGRVVPVELGARPREAFLSAVVSIRRMVWEERFPEPTKYRGFCPQCEYVRFCGDVL